jgi:hypothetical protein
VLEWFARDKHSSLFGLFVSENEKKKFLTNDHQEAEDCEEGNGQLHGYNTGQKGCKGRSALVLARSNFIKLFLSVNYGFS